MWSGWSYSRSCTLSDADGRMRMAVELTKQSREHAAETIEAPAPTPWPIALAFGITLLFAGLVTSGAISVLGAIVAIAGAVGWFRAVLPHVVNQAGLVEA